MDTTESPLLRQEGLLVRTLDNQQEETKEREHRVKISQWSERSRQHTHSSHRQLESTETGLGPVTEESGFDDVNGE